MNYVYKLKFIGSPSFEIGVVHLCHLSQNWVLVTHIQKENLWYQEAPLPMVRFQDKLNQILGPTEQGQHAEE